MANFYFEGRDQEGKLIKGNRVAESAELLSGELFKQNITPIKIKQTAGGKKTASFWTISIGKPKVKTAELALFTRQMYTLSKSGVTIITAIKHLAESTRTPYFSSILQNIAAQLEGGKNLANAMQSYKNVFSPLIIGMVQVGQSSGRLDDAFLNLTRYLELEESTLKRVKTAIRYPVIVMISIVVAVIVIMTFVIPTFARIYAKANVPLPIFTIYLIAISDLVAHYWYIFVLTIVFIIFIVRTYLKTKEGRYKWDRLKLRLPVLGVLITRMVLLRFTQTFSIVMNAGIPIIEGLSLVSLSVENAFARAEVQAMQRAIQEGNSIVQSANMCKLFTPLEIQMLAISEKTGELGAVLNDISQYYQREVEYDLKRLTDAIEPIVLVAMAILVLLLALSVYLPIWNMVKLVHH